MLLLPHVLSALQTPLCDKGQGSWKAPCHHEVWLGLWSVTESGLAFAFGLALPIDARKSSVFKGLRPHITSKVGTMKALGSKSLRVKGGEKEER